MQKLGYWAFGGITNLESVTINSTVSQSCNQPFNGSNILQITFGNITKIPGGIFNSANLAGVSSVTIPSSVTEIDENAFSNSG